MTTLDKMLQGLANALGASLSTLTTTAKTVVGAINELKSGLTTANTNISTNASKIGTGSLNTTAQTIIPAINEIEDKAMLFQYMSGAKSITSGSYPGYTENDYAKATAFEINLKAGEMLWFSMTSSNPNASLGYGYLKNVTAPTYISGSALNAGWVNSTNYYVRGYDGNTSSISGLLITTAATTIKLLAYYTSGTITVNYDYRVI